MTTYNTGNPVPSTKPQDLYDNAENLDAAVNDRSNDKWVDRLGNERLTWEGMTRLSNLGAAVEAAERAEEAAAEAIAANRTIFRGTKDELLAAMQGPPVQEDETPGRVTNDPAHTDENPVNGDYIWRGGVLVYSDVQPLSKTDLAATNAQIDQVQDQLGGALTDLGAMALATYSGGAPDYPIITGQNQDGDNVSLLYWDDAIKKLRGELYAPVVAGDPGVTKMLHESYAGELGTVEYIGSGPVIPLYMSSNRVVLLGWDIAAAQFVGALIGGTAQSTKAWKVVQSEDMVQLYRKGSGLRWTEHIFRHVSNLDPEADPDSRYDVWQAYHVWEGIMLGGVFTRTRRIVRSGEWECAIKEILPETGEPAPDFMGGAIHGQEFLDWAYFMVDGVQRQIDDYGSFECDEFRVVLQSKLYKYGGEPGTDPRVEVQRLQKNTQWTLQADGRRRLDQKYLVVTPFQTNWTYIAMLPINRKQETNAALNITDAAAMNPDWELLDVAEAGFPPNPNPAFDHGRIWGASGCNAEVQILKGWDRPGRRSRIASSDDYNKFYFDFTGTGVDLAAGEIIEMSALYHIDTNA